MAVAAEELRQTQRPHRALHPDPVRVLPTQAKLEGLFVVRGHQLGQAGEPEQPRSRRLDTQDPARGEDRPQWYPRPEGHRVPDRMHQPGDPAGKGAARRGEGVRCGGKVPRRDREGGEGGPSHRNPHRGPVPAPAAD